MEPMDTSPGDLPKFARQLALLAYPGRASFDIYATHSVRALVLWLEATVFQFLGPEERLALEAQEGDEWRANAFHEYLETLGSPFAYGRGMDDAQMASVVEWLLHYALGLRYQRDAAHYTRTAHAHAQRARASLLVADDAELAPAFVEAVSQLARRAGLVQAVVAPEDARDVLLACVRHALRAPQAEGGAEAFSLAAFPLGFDTGDAALNNAATVLRLLYAEDLHQLQARINALLVAVQNLTANPEVDASLGSVGR